MPIALSPSAARQSNEKQVWFVSEHLVDVPLVKAD
jgi:hypothetical protein